MNLETKGEAPNTWRKNHGPPTRRAPQRTQENRESSRGDPTSARHCEVADTVTHREVQFPGAATLPEEEKPNTWRKKIREPGAQWRASRRGTVTRCRRPNSRVSQRCLRRRIPALRKISLPAVDKYVSPPSLAVMRSYQGYYTRSHQNSEVKRLWAGIVLGWVTSREVPVLHPFSKNLENIFPLNCFAEKDPTTKENKLQKRIRGTNSRQGRNPRAGCNAM